MQGEADSAQVTILDHPLRQCHRTTKPAAGNSARRRWPARSPFLCLLVPSRLGASPSTQPLSGQHRARHFSQPHFAPPLARRGDARSEQTLQTGRPAPSRIYSASSQVGPAILRFLSVAPKPRAKPQLHRSEQREMRKRRMELYCCHLSGPLPLRLSKRVMQTQLLSPRAARPSLLRTCGRIASKHKTINGGLPQETRRTQECTRGGGPERVKRSVARDVTTRRGKGGAPANLGAMLSETRR